MPSGRGYRQCRSDDADESDETGPGLESKFRLAVATMSRHGQQPPAPRAKERGGLAHLVPTVPDPTVWQQPYVPGAARRAVAGFRAEQLHHLGDVLPDHVD